MCPRWPVVPSNLSGRGAEQGDRFFQDGVPAGAEVRNRRRDEIVRLDAVQGRGDLAVQGERQRRRRLTPPGRTTSFDQPQAPVVGVPTSSAPASNMPDTKCSQALAQPALVKTATRPA